MNILITGVAGFIGFHTSKLLLRKKHNLYGIDNLNDYYDVNLKQARLNQLRQFSKFDFFKKNIEDHNLPKIFKKKKIDIIINLAAQAGVRHSLKDPYSYINSNVMGQLNMLEVAKVCNVKKFIYASSSSVYGGNKILPFSIKQRVDNPISLYAASKKSTELLSECYSHLFGIQCVGLRFFTVYGPWGRPDMATFIFTKKIIEKKKIDIFNYGKMERDFTFIDDVVDGIYGAVKLNKKFKHKVYNLGNSHPEILTDFIALIENTLNIKAKKNLIAIQPGDVKKTFADIQESKNDLSFSPKTKIQDGIPKFIKWYKKYYEI
jgi:UDP-glucuronate 4-epimerase